MREVRAELLNFVAERRAFALKVANVVLQSGNQEVGFGMNAPRRK